MPPDRNGADSPGSAANPRDLARASARCFASPDGAAVLAHLTAMTMRRALGPDASDQALRHLEGQRQLVAHLHALIARGRAGGRVSDALSRKDMQ
jgi:hypothetical protein